MEMVLANKITDLIQSTDTIDQLNQNYAKIEAIGTIQTPISELEKRLNVRFDKQDLDK